MDGASHDDVPGAVAVGLLVDDLLLAARTAPGLVLSMHQSVSGFDTFLARADGVRDAPRT